MSDRDTEPRERHDPIEWASLYGERREDEQRPDDVPFAGEDAERYAIERGYRPIHAEPAWRALLRRLWAPIAGLGILLWKLKFVFAAVFKLKFFTTIGSALVSIGAYALIWGWAFGVGFVVLLFVHELGHVLEAKRQGLKVSAPMFVPFLGALILLKEMPANVYREAQVALAGPILGSLGAAAFWVAGEATGRDYFLALAYVGFFLNLFNLAPVWQLDGARAISAVHPGLWIPGLVLMAGLLFVFPSPILVIIVVLGALQAWRWWQHRDEPGQRRYYEITRAQRIAVGVTYVGLAILLAGAMEATFLERDI
jgi:Zn-dependent protease